MERQENIMRNLLKLADFTVDPHYSIKTEGVPFHGDHHTISYISTYLLQADIFVETGTAYSDSSYYVASNFPNMPVYTNEPWDERYNISNSVLKNCSNVFHSRTPSPEFFREIEEREKNLFDMTAVFWLDAHGDWIEADGTRKFSWPLPQEIDYITKNFKKYYIFIDDFQNPYNVHHKFDEYHQPGVSLICGPEMIKDQLNGASLYHLNHNFITSKMQPFVVGIGLVTNQPLLEDDEPIVKNNFDYVPPSEMFVYRTY
jgi:hypothetical protein